MDNQHPSKYTTPKDQRDEFSKDITKEESSFKNANVRKRIDELLEQHRLKNLLDNTDDWDI